MDPKSLVNDDISAEDLEEMAKKLLILQKIASESLEFINHKRQQLWFLEQILCIIAAVFFQIEIMDGRNISFFDYFVNAVYEFCIRRNIHQLFIWKFLFHSVYFINEFHFLNQNLAKIN